jgi:hypothetical protein
MEPIGNRKPWPCKISFVPPNEPVVAAVDIESEWANQTFLVQVIYHQYQWAQRHTQTSRRCLDDQKVVIEVPNL